MATAAPISVADSIKQRFAASQVTKAAILDDTFDGLTADYLNLGLGKFVSDLQEDERLPALQQLLPEVTEAEEFDIDAAKKLWIKKSEWTPKIVPLANDLFGEYERKLSRLNDIRTALEQLGLEVQFFGTDPSKYGALADVQILFLDYQLEATTTTATAAAAAATGAQMGQQIVAGQSKSVAIASKLASGTQRPFLVLISSITTLAEVQAQFRESTNYVGGTFGFLPKEKAAVPAELFHSIRGWGIGHPALPAVSDFISTLQKSAKEVAEEFGATLLKLEVQDYSFIQRLSLAADGEPLGEYMLQMLSESLSHRLRNDAAVIASRQKLDQIHFASHLPSALSPSDTVSHLYREAFTDRDEETLAPHPLQHAQVPAPAVVFDRVMQGDIFRAPGEPRVYILVNCGCQLQFSPINEKRQPTADTMLLLLVGNLKLFSDPIGKLDVMRTEPFLVDGVAYRIIWNSDHVMPVSRGDFKNVCAAKNLKRIARLRDVHAAAIQQYWSATTARIGLPVSPPSFSPADFEIYILSDKKLTKHGERIVGEVIMTEHVADRELVRSFTLTSAGVDRLGSAFTAAATAMRQDLSTNPPTGPRAAEQQAGIESAIAAAEAQASAPGALFSLMETNYPLKREPGSAWKETGPLTGLIAFFWHAELQGKKQSDVKNLNGRPTIVVNIVPPHGTGTTPPMPAEAPPPAPAAPDPAAEAVPTPPPPVS